MIDMRRDELRERALRDVDELLPNASSLWSAMQEVAARYDVHPNTLRRWRKQADLASSMRLAGPPAVRELTFRRRDNEDAWHAIGAYIADTLGSVTEAVKKLDAVFDKDPDEYLRWLLSLSAQTRDVLESSDELLIQHGLANGIPPARLIEWSRHNPTRVRQWAKDIAAERAKDVDYVWQPDGSANISQQE